MSLLETEISSEENIVRAVTSADWDNQNNRWSSQLFKGSNISVSRLAILDLEKLMQIFHQQLDKPNKIVVGAGKINVGKLKEIGKSQDTTLTVVEKAEIENPAHAEIPQKISRSLAFRIIEALEDKPIYPKEQFIKIVNNQK